MVVPRLLLLDDQVEQLVPALARLQELGRVSQEIYLFLQEASTVFRREIASLGLVERQAIGWNCNIECDSLLELAERCDQSQHHDGVIHSVIRHICCLGDIFSLVQNHHLLSTHSGKLYVVGLGNSPLAAAALATARDTCSLRKASVETIPIAFRLALAIQQRGIHIEPGHGNWARTVSAANREQLMELIHEHEIEGTPVARHIYIAEEAPNCFTICGPPSNLAKFCSSLPDAMKLSDWSVSMHGPKHAPQLPAVDLETVIGNSDILHTPVSETVDVPSLRNNLSDCALDLGALLLQACNNTCHQTFKLEASVASAVAALKPSNGRKLEIVLVGQTNRSRMFQRLLSSNGVDTKICEPLNTEASSDERLFSPSGSIAVVGMAGRFPGSDDVEQFWESLLSGKEYHQRVPSNRFDLPTWHQVSGEEGTSLPYGCFLDQPDLFDHRLFNISPREALQMDPNQRLLLTVTYEALQRAGYCGEDTLSTRTDRISTFIGQTTDDWREVTAGHGIDIYYVPGLLRIFAAGRLHYHFKWEGASLSLDAACASSSAAISHACDALLAQRCDMAVAGGVNSLASPGMFAGLKKGGFLSSTGGCKPFHQAADGYCRGEGTGVVILKRLEDAMQANDNIVAVIRGQGRSHSAHATSITHPDSQEQERLFRRVLREAGLSPTNIGYVEMHGTGTQAGDDAEVTAVGNVFSPGKTPNRPLAIGAVKANVGHAEAAAGVISLIKSIMVLRTGKIPAQPGMPFQMNARIQYLRDPTVRVADGLVCMQDTTAPGQARRVMMNNFDAAGGNGCIVLEEAPPKHVKPADPRSHHPVAISGQTPSSLRQNQANMLRFLTAGSSPRLADLSYTTTARGIHETLRVVYVADSIDNVVHQLRQDIDRQGSIPKANGAGAPGVGFVFTGMSSQYAGMGSQLFNTSPRFRKTIISLQGICHGLGLPPFVELIADPTVDMGTRNTIQIQLAIVCLELSLADLWRSWGIEPAFVIGHSLGEYSALCVAGVLSSTDTLSLVGLRASLMEETMSPGAYAMLAVSQCTADITHKLNKLELRDSTVSCINAPSSTVVSGPANEIRILQEDLASKGIRTSQLNCQHGFHSSQFDAILVELVKKAVGIPFSPPRIPVASTMLGTVVQGSGVFGAEYLAKQSRQPVEFMKAVKSCLETGIADSNTVWLEVGPDSVCVNLLRGILGDAIRLPTVKRSENNWKTISAAASILHQRAVPMKWTKYHEDFIPFLSLLELPTYAFDEKSYWRTYRHVTASLDSAIPSASTRVAPLSTSLHYMTEESLGDSEVVVEFISDLQEPDLNAAIQGHHLENASLCPSSVFCDIALTAARYIQERLRKGQSDNLAWEVCDLNMEHPIVVPPSPTNNAIKTEARTNTTGSEGNLQLTFSHHLSDGVTRPSGNGAIRFGDREQWEKELAASEFFVNSRARTIETLPSCSRLRKHVVYKLFDNVVQYAPLYQAIDELYWDESGAEAVAKVKLQDHDGAQRSEYSPYWLDSIIHLAGFILNASLTSTEHVHVCNGLGSLRILERLSANTTYRCYVRVRAQPDESKGTSLSDVYLFHGQRLIGVCLGLRFQRLPRRVFRRVLQQAQQDAQGGAPGEEALGTRAEDTSGGETKHQPDSTSGSPQDRNREEAPGLLLRLISEETGVEMGSIGPDTAFAEIGVDSILGFTIIDRFNELSSLKLGSSFFAQAGDVASVAAWFHQKNGTSASPDKDNEKPTLSLTPNTTSSGADSERSSGVAAILTPPTPLGPGIDDAKPQCKASLLQGDPAKHSAALFLLAGGAGRAARFYHLPQFVSELPVYALDSPFLHQPEDYCSTVQELASIYIATIQNLQPQGPYMVGGYSAGAVHAYEVAYQLLAMGHTVSHVVILDMHAPVSPPVHNAELTREIIHAIGFVQKGSKEHYVEGHKERLLAAMLAYQPQPMRSGCRPTKSILIWARRAVWDELSPDQLQRAQDFGLAAEVEGSNVMQDPLRGLGWFFSRRHDFGPNGWDALLGGPQSVECYTVDEATHMSLMSPPAVSSVGRILEQAINI